MKTKRCNWRSGVSQMFLGMLFLLTSVCLCRGQAGSLRDENTGNSIDASARKVIILIHGWNPDDVSDMYAGGPSDPWPSLINDAKQKLVNSDWKLFTFHWEHGHLLGANTGPIFDWNLLGFDVVGVGDAVVAAMHADQQGHNLASLLSQSAPTLRRVQLIAHSAGAWVAREVAADILQSNSYVTVQITLLDPFIPDVIPEQSTGLSKSYMSQLASVTGNDRISLLENYYADDIQTYLPTEQTFSWPSVDINQEVDWSPLLSDYYDSHSGPIEFYGDTVYQSIAGNPTPSGLYGFGCPFDYSQVGWLRSLFYTDELKSPGISVQPQSQSAYSGSTIVLSVTASSSQSLSYQWFHSGQPISGATTALYSFTLTSSSAGDYVVKVSYQHQHGYIFSDKATVTIATPAAPSITSVSPSTLTGLPLPQTQRIQIIGSGFTSSSTLVFNDGVNSYNSDPARLTFVNANELDYLIAVGVNPATWTVKVINGSQTSNLGTFSVASPSSAINVTCYVSPSTVSPNAAFTVSGTATYNNGGGAVVAGTVTIVIGGQTYTAAINSGSYSRQISAPSSGGTYPVSVTVTDGSGLTGLNSASLVVNSNGSTSGYTIDNFFTCTNADSAYPYDAYGEIDGFGSAAPRFYAWLELGSVTGAHSIELRLYRPDGTYYGNATGTVGAAGQAYDWWRIWWYWAVSGYDIAYTPGLWDLKLYIDGVYQQSISFTIRYQFTEHLMAKGVQSTTPFDPIQPSNIFYQTDQEALTWLNLDKVSDAINVKWIFYEPNGSEYSETAYSSPVASGYAYWSWYKYWGEINIVGNSAANKCGSWKVDVMIQDPSANWVKQYTDYFQIIESPPQPPVCAVGLTPTNPIACQTLTLNVSATDNTYLQSLVLYWNDGSLHSYVWNNVISNSINQSQSIGTYTTGQHIEYWGVATDTSGNTTESIHTFAVIPDTTPPTLSITSPANYATVTNASLSVGGTATDSGNGNNGISLVTVDGIAANGGTASGSGTANWNATITLNSGVNAIAVTAYDSAGNNTSATLTVTLSTVTGTTTNTVFTESGNGSSIDTNKWTTSGNTVVESGGMMQVLTTVTDQGGVLNSLPIPINPHGDITITRSTFVHYANQYCAAKFNMKCGNLGWNGVYYANYIWSGNPFYGWEDRYGIYLLRNDAYIINQSSDTNLAGPFSPIWDTWFTEKLVYSPDTGNLKYFTNNVEVADFNIGVMPPTNNPTLQLQFTAWGWYTGHEQLFSNLVVTQVVPAPPSSQITDYSLANGIFRFTLSGQVGSNYVIYASSDLTYWTPLSTNTIPPAGLITFVDPSAGGYAKRFYRAVMP